MSRLLGLFLWEISFAAVALSLGVAFVFVGLRLGAEEMHALSSYGWLFLILLVVMGAWRALAGLLAQRLSDGGKCASSHES